MDILAQNIRHIKGIGDKIEYQLNQNKIFTYLDLIEYFPKKYTLYEINDLMNISIDTKVTTIGIINSQIICRKFRRSIDNLIFSMSIFGKNIKVIIFGKGFLRFNLKKGMKITVYGIYKPHLKEIIATNVFFEEFQFKIDVDYKLDNISNLQMQKFINLCLLELKNTKIIDYLPKYLIEKYRLLSKQQLLIKAHFPHNKKDLHEISRRLKYEEFLNYAVSLESLKYHKNQIIKIKRIFDIKKVTDYIENLPYKLTNDQSQVISTILAELASDKLMNRLVQGDVGSGKSVVALIVAFATVLANMQVVVMAPTEILANQHYNYFKNELTRYKISVELLTKNVKKSDKAEILERLIHGRIHVLIGTHALLEENVVFKKLGLAIIDEQHRFGVDERTMLVNKCPNVDALFLTATPIPRTLGLTSFGDLDLSAIKTMPIGRKPVITRVISELDLLFIKMKQCIMNNEQIYVVVPLVTESETLAIYDTSSAYELISHALPEAKIDILHGRLKATEKIQIMSRFKAKAFNILISTTVIEVGVDIKNATLMVIFNAERFGLSQLHQLRGRVGRNDMQSYCYLISDTMNCERLNILERCNDGFSLSDEDFLLRGPGDYLGERQSGFNRFDVADFSKDENIWKVACLDATELFRNHANNEVKYPIIEKIMMRLNNKTIKLN